MQVAKPFVAQPLTCTSSASGTRASSTPSLFSTQNSRARLSDEFMRRTAGQAASFSWTCCRAFLERSWQATKLRNVCTFIPKGRTIFSEGCAFLRGLHLYLNASQKQCFAFVSSDISPLADEVSRAGPCSLSRSARILKVWHSATSENRCLKPHCCSSPSDSCLGLSLEAVLMALRSPSACF